MTRPWKPSVTVAAVVERGGRFLMVEDVSREVMEESAHPFRPNALLGVYIARSAPKETPQGVTYVRFAFTGELGQGQPGRALDHGILRAVWLTADEIRERAAEHRSPLVMKCVDDYLTGRRFPLDLVYTHASALA